VRRRIVLLAAVALVGIAAFAVSSGASAKPDLDGSAAGAAASASCYPDAVRDAGDAPDITLVTIRPVAAGLQIDVRLAEPTELGPYGWILVGLDTDRNAFTGGGRGDELLAFTNGDGTTLTQWVDGRFTPDFPHHRFAASFSGTDLRLTFARADVRARSFDFSVASLRERADLAPGGGVAAYPGGPSRRCGDASPVRTPLPARRGVRRTTSYLERRSQT
jgi:hypothetical protein